MHDAENIWWRRGNPALVTRLVACLDVEAFFFFSSRVAVPWLPIFKCMQGDSNAIRNMNNTRGKSLVKSSLAVHE